MIGLLVVSGGGGLDPYNSRGGPYINPFRNDLCAVTRTNMKAQNEPDMFVCAGG